jgi:hypothetical protein
MEPMIDLTSCLAEIPDRRRAEGKMYGQVGMILFSIIAMLSGARSYRQIDTLIDRRLAILNAAFPQVALRRGPALTSVIARKVRCRLILARSPPHEGAAPRAWLRPKFAPSKDAHLCLSQIKLYSDSLKIRGFVLRFAVGRIPMG